MIKLRWLSFLLIAALAGATLLSACGSSGGSSSSSGSTEEGGAEETSEEPGSSGTNLAAFEEVVKEAEAPITSWPANAPTELVKKVEPNKLIVDVALSPEEPASLAAVEGVVEAAKVIGWQSKVIYTEFSAANTNSAFEQAIALGADAVIAQGIEPSEFQSSINKLHESGAVFVGMFNAEGTTTGADAEVTEHPREAGEAMASKMIADAGGKGQFAEFGYPIYKDNNERGVGLEKKFSECSECELLPLIKVNSAEAEKTLPTATSTLLQQNPDLTAIVSSIDTFLDLYQLPVFREQGGEVAVYTYNGSGATLEALKKDEIKAVDVYALPWSGWEAINCVAYLLAGQPPGGEGVPNRLISQENIARAYKTSSKNGFWDGEGFDYKGEYEKLWGLK
jgi:ribose transport system substrate-binding protein